MGQFEGDDHRETKGVIFVETVVCLVEPEGGESRERENWADFRISAHGCTSQAI